jgi:hypothetical protein
MGRRDRVNGAFEKRKRKKEANIKKILPRKY